MSRRTRTRGLRTVISMTAFFTVTSAAAGTVHEEGVLTIASPKVTAGSSVGLRGGDFSANTPFTLVLRGALDSYDVGRVESDADGSFSIGLEIPGDVRPGVYRLVAVAPDGDDAATVDLEVEPAPAEGEVAESGESEPTAHTTGMPAPRAEEITIERRWSGLEWFLVGLVIGGALVGGTALYRRPKSVGSS